MSKDKLTIKARYGIKHTLEKIGDNRYKFINGSSFGVCRVTTNPYNTDEILELDPEGGPRFVVGNYLLGKIVKFIEFIDKCYIITFEDDISSK